MRSPLDLYKFLEKTNCRECGVPSCMAFAAMAMQGQKKLKDCPYVKQDLIESFDINIKKRPSPEEDQLKIIEELKKKIQTMDFEEAAHRLGGMLVKDKIEIKCLGKNFFIDKKGDLSSDCHTHIWLKGPLLSYFIYCKGEDLSGRWRLLKELDRGNDWHSFFNRRCVTPLKNLADDNYKLFSEVLNIFGEKYENKDMPADLSVLLYPLPRIPFLICYVKTEDDLESNINIFFDSSASRNINIESLYTLGAGMAIMFDKFIKRHDKFQYS